MIYYSQMEFIWGMQNWSNIQKSMNVIHKVSAPGQNLMCDLSGLTKVNCKGFTWQVSLGKATSKTYTADLVHSHHTALSGDSCSKGLTSPCLASFLWISTLLAQEPLLRGFLIRGPSAKASLRCSCLSYLL